MVAPVPTPSYIDWDNNVSPLIGGDKIIVSDDDDTAIPTATAASLIAESESLVLADLSPYYITYPALITEDGQDWTYLPSSTYNFIYFMFVYRSADTLINSFIALNNNMRKTVNDFSEYFSNQARRFYNRIEYELRNGSFKYDLIGLQKKTSNAIPRSIKSYASVATIGENSNYAARQNTNPQQQLRPRLPWAN